MLYKDIEEEEDDSSSSILVDDIAASEDILGEIILYKSHFENIFVYIVMSTLYIVIII